MKEVESKPDDYKTLLVIHEQQVSSMNNQIFELQSLVADLLAHFKIYSNSKDLTFTDEKLVSISA